MTGAVGLDLDVQFDRPRAKVQVEVGAVGRNAQVGREVFVRDGFDLNRRAPTAVQHQV